MKVLLNLAVTLMIFIALPLNVIGQDVIFNSCENIIDNSERQLCDQERIGSIIKKRIWQYYKDYVRKFPESKLELTFNINEGGVIENIYIDESSSSSHLYRSSRPIIIQDTLVEDFNFASNTPNAENYNIINIRFPIADYNTPIFNFIDPENILIIFPTQAIFKVVEQIPRFPGCEDLATEREKEDCARTKMLDYIYANLEYPEAALKNGTEGQVVVSFIVEMDGTISSINIVRELGDGCGQAAVDVVQSMNEMPEHWISGRQRGRNVRVLYTLPVKFKL